MMATNDQCQIWEEAASQPNNILVRRFSSDWRRDKASPPDPASYLPDDPGRRPAALLALLRADLTLRREAGERACVEWYLRRFPELPSEALVALAYEEYCVRDEAGEAPDLEEYDTRFPAIAAELRELIDIHEFVDSSRDLLEGEGPRKEDVLFPSTGETIGGFRLVEELGRGGMARVFLALERHLANRRVALKVTRAGSPEPQTLALLQHTHIVPVFSYHVDAVTGLHLLCMPYFGRVTLADLLAAPRARSARTGAAILRSPHLTSSRRFRRGEAAERRRRASLLRQAYVRPGAIVAWWGARLAEALQYAHDCGVLHHDIKPSNVLVTAGATPMLLDFNLARSTRPESQGLAAIGGTLAYMAPEHFDAVAELRDDTAGDDSRLDGRADIYSLGVVLHEAAGLSPRSWRPELSGSAASANCAWLIALAEGRSTSAEKE